MTSDELAAEREAARQRQRERDARHAAEHKPRPRVPFKKALVLGKKSRKHPQLGDDDYLPPWEWIGELGKGSRR